MNTSNRRRRGFSLIELLIVIAIILIIVAIAVPKMDKAKMHAMEMAAINNMRTIHTAQTQYYSQYGKYAAKLEELGPPPSGNDSPAGANLIPGDFAKGVKQGYQYTLVGGPQGYTINANPVAFNGTGRRTFFSDQSMVIRENWGSEPATAASGEIK